MPLHCPRMVLQLFLAVIQTSSHGAAAVPLENHLDRACLRSDVLTGMVEKKRQGVIWGKTAASFKGPGIEKLVLKLASFVELHSTVASKDAIIK